MRYIVASIQVVLFLVTAMATEAEDRPEAATRKVQQAQENVFLGDWLLLGPFPANSTDVEAPTIESVSRAVGRGEPLPHDDQSQDWIPWPHRVIDFRSALDANGDEGENAIAYAVTRFHVDRARSAVLSLSYDDHATAWLNGLEVHHDEKSRTSATIDQKMVAVELKEGTNTLLLKVGQGYLQWEVAARLLPAGAEQPLMSLRFSNRYPGDVTRIPVLSLELLSRDGAAIRQMRSSGLRSTKFQGTCYRVHGDPLTEEPASVRVSWNAPGLKPQERTLSWPDVLKEKVKLRLLSDQPLRMVVSDEQTGQPIQGAQLWKGAVMLRNTTGADGRVSVSHLNPLATDCYVVGDGYEARKVDLPWPFAGQLEVKLEPGGRTVRGKVVSPDGKPIAKAKISPGLYRGYTPKFSTDKKGEFVIYGVPSAKPRLFPVIEADGFVTKDTFGFDLAPEGPTEVTWELPKATVIVGTVTDAVTGRGIGGVTLASGRDRFASNRKNPQTKTNPDGSFQLKGVPEGGVLVHAFSDHHSPQMKSVTATLQEPTEVNFEIAAGRPVAGTVKDPKGKPLAGVWLVTDTWDGVRMFRRETRSDAQGRFTLSHMPDTPAEVHVLLQNYVSKRDLTVVGGDIVDLTLRPIIEHTVRILTQEQKEPVPDLKIQKGYLWAGRSEVSWDGRDYQSDRYYDKATGVFRIRNGETPSGAQISYRFRSVGYEDVVLEVPDPDDGPQSIDIAMKPVGLIHGTIVDAETGQAMPDVAVAVLTKEDRLRADMYINFRPAYLALERFTGTQVVSEEDGRFQLPKQSDWEGVSLVLLSRDGGFHFIEDARAVLQHSAEPRLPMPAAGSVEGTVTEAGQGVAGESIRVSWQGPGAEPRWDLPFGVGGKVDTDHDGKFAFATLGPGRYKIYRVRSFESESSSGSISMYMSGEDLVVMPGQTTTHNLDRPAGLRAVGQTLDADGKAVPQCVVTVRPADDVLARIDAVRSDASGHFEFANLQPGEYTFDATMYQRSAVNTCGLGNEKMRGSETVSFDADATFSLEMSEISASSLPESLTGRIAPSFSATPIDHDSPFSTADAWGKVVAIDFWATWCGPCMAVMPQLKELYEKHKNDPDFVLITVSLDQDEDQLHKVIKDQELEFPVVWQGDGWQDGLAKQFGVSSIPASFVIGRDGTFASDRIHGSKLAAAVEDALKRELDPAIRDQPPACLTIRATLDGQADGVPGLRLSLKAINAEGKTIRENQMNMPGPTVQTQWRYPGLTDGGTVVVTASIPGADEQRRELADPSAKETIEFDFDSPQVLRGQLTQQGEPLSVPGVKITVRENGGFTRETTTDDEGRFEVGCIAGRYSAQATSDKYVQVPTRVKPIVIQSDRPSQPVSIDMCQAKTLVGMVLAPDGAPADRAKVRLIQGEPVSTDEQGRFSLPGVPSVGKVTIYAGGDDGAGKLDVEDFDGQGGTTIALTAPGGRGGLAVGSKVPPWNVTDLDSNPVDWGAQGGNRLIVFAPLWHPEGRRLVKKAAQFGRESKTPIVLVSLDWTREAAKRHLDELSFDGQVLFAGGGGLGLDPEWKIGQSPQAILVSPRSTVLANPLAD